MPFPGHTETILSSGSIKPSGFYHAVRSAIACRMALLSYQEHRAVKWDAEREEIV
jgi:hypothetical protein